MRVHDVMTKPVVSCRPQTNRAEAAGIMWDHRCGAGIPQGILSLNDIVLWAQHSDGVKRQGISYEDIVNTLVAIGQRSRRDRSRAAVAA